jgi:hypothetical protein
MDIDTLITRTREHASRGLLPSAIVRALFKEFGEFSAVYLIQCFSKGYGVAGADIGHFFAAWWPNAQDSISDNEFNDGLLNAIERSKTRHA